MPKCIINVITRSYNTETSKREFNDPIQVGEIEKNQRITLDEVARQMAALSPEVRGQLATQFVDASPIDITKKIIEEHQLVGNITIADLCDLYPKLKDIYDQVSKNPRLGNFNILHVSEFTYNGVGYNGRVIAPEGEEIFIMKNEWGATSFMKYLQIKDLALRLFGDEEYKFATPETEEDQKSLEGIKSRLTSGDVSLMDELAAFAKHKKLSIVDTISAYMEDKKSFDPIKFKGKNGETQILTPAKTFKKLIAILLGEYDNTQNFTDLELGLENIRAQKTKKEHEYDWIFGQKKLYDTLNLYYPEISESLSYEKFAEMSEKELQELFTGNDGIFVGHPKLQRAVVHKELLAKGKEKKDTSKNLLISKVSRIKELWPCLTAAFPDFPESYEVAQKLSDKEKQDLIKRIKETGQKATFVDEDGVEHTIEIRLVDKKSTAESTEAAKASETTEAAETVKATKAKSKKASKTKAEPAPKSTKKFEFRDVYTIEANGEKGADVYEIRLEFPYSSIGDVYNFGYGPKYIFMPYTGDESPLVQNSMYKGMYIYKATVNNKPVYAISRSIISPNSYMQTFPTLEAAIHGIDERFNKDIIGENSLYSIKQTGGAIPRTTELELKSVKEGQIITVLNIDLPKYKISDLPPSIRQLFKFTVPEFHKYFPPKLEDSISKINTPEKAAAFIIEFYDSLDNQRDAEDITQIQKSNKISALTDLFQDPDREDVINNIIDSIDKATTRSYFIEKLIDTKATSFKSSVKVATLKLLARNGTSIKIGAEKTPLSINTEGTRIGDTPVNQFIEQTMTDIIDFFQNSYGVTVHKLSADDLADFDKEKNLGIGETNIPSTKAFIHNGEIYINTSSARVSDLFHEMAHLFMGVMKVKDPDAYNKLIEFYQTDMKKKKVFLRKFGWAKKHYKNFAQSDIIEEAVAEMIADEIYTDKELFNPLKNTDEENTEFSNKLGTLFQRVFGTFESFTKNAEGNDNGLGAFNNLIKSLLQENGDQLKKRRIITNQIHQMIASHQINEGECT